MKTYIAGLLMAAAVPVASGQTSAYQDASGNTSIYLANAKANLTYNVSDSKFNIGYLHEPGEQKKESSEADVAEAKKKLDILQSLVSNAEKDGKSHDIIDHLNAQVTAQKEVVDRLNSNVANAKKIGPCPRCEYGISFSGKPSTNLGNQIFQTSNSPATVTGGGAVGLNRVVAKDLFDQDGSEHLRGDWLLVNVSYTRSTFSTVSSGSTTPIAQHFNGFTILPVYNSFFNFSKVQMLVGTGAGINRTNNTGDMTKVQISTAQSSSGSVTVVSPKDAYQGAYTESIGVPIYSDFVFIPKILPWLGIDAFERANVVPTNGYVVPTNGYTEGGCGLFFAKPDKPTQVLGGISFDWKNGKNEVAIVAGWSF